MARDLLREIGRLPPMPKPEPTSAGAAGSLRRAHMLSAYSSRPISMRRISLVPAPIS